MNSATQIKELVRQKYGEIAGQNPKDNKASCCGSGGCSDEVYNIMTEDHGTLEGYFPEADLGLGCGLPTQFAGINPGDTVIDLGSGAGNDCFIARHETGANGKVIGVDFTDAMLERARSNAEKLGYTNVEFRKGDIEDLPIEDDTADVVVSNCVLILVPDKDKVFKEIFRTLKPGGHFSISDIVISGELPDSIKSAAEMYAGCVAGAIQRDEYLGLIAANGFSNITLQKDRTIDVPDDILRQYLSDDALAEFKASGTGIYSITVYAERPATA
ncbi:MAG: arsenite methyltransferase [Pyrinomonadaceae bacterium]|nr:arsenite methyltransferase [Pyrinomonadaceae bacterium]